MAIATTLTVKKTTKAKYDEIREKANQAFRLEYAVPIAFKQIDFFDTIIDFILINEGRFMEFLTKPTDSAFWKGDS
jgi:hypothetical protein